MIEKKSKAIKIGAVCLAGALVAGVAGSNVYAMGKNNSSGKSSDEKKLEEELKDTVKNLWSPASDAVVSKEETVYVMAGADGSSNKIIVSDWIKNAGQEKSLTDFTGLKDVEAVKNGESFTVTGDKYVWNTEGGDVYYQGTSDKELPLTVKAGYTLDGKELSASEIAGKSGHVVIRYSFEAKEYVTAEIAGKQEKIAVPFTVVTGMILDRQQFSNVEVSSGKLVNDGDKSVVVGLAFPGMNENLQLDEDIDIPDYVEVEADVKDFSLGSTYCIAVNNLFSSLNLDEVDSLDELSDAMEDLADGMTQLLDGSSDLYDGLATLYDKSGELKDGVEQLAKGVGDLQSGAGTLRDGAKKLADGAGTLKNGAGSLKSGAAQLNAGLGTLVSKNGELTGGARQVFETLLKTANDTLNSNAQMQQLGVTANMTIDNYAAFLDGLLSQLGGSEIQGTVYEQVVAAVTAEVENNTPAITAAVAAEVEKSDAAIRAGVTDAVRENVLAQVIASDTVQNACPGFSREMYEQAKGISVSGGDAQLAALQALAAQIDAAVDANMQSAEVQAAIESNVAAKKQELIDANVAAKKNELIQTNVEQQMQAQAGNLSAGAAQIAGLKASLDSYNQFYQGLIAYTNGVASAKDGAAQLENGAAQLESGAGALASGAGELATGTESLKSGTDTLKKGIDSLAEGSDALLDGVKQLKDGALELKDGLVTFDEEGISKILDAFDEDSLSEKLDRFKAAADAAKSYRSYAGIADDMEGSVKFIYKLEEIQ